ncbi:MAG: glycoside hydrolase family 3 N-terminal domain-containing protein [Prolixibacteraceae bacterium]
MLRKIYFLLICLIFVGGKYSAAQQQLLPYLNPDLPIDQRVDDLIGRMTIEEKASQMVDAAAELPQLNVPQYGWWSEALHGVARAGKATIFPQAIGMAATFDPDLIHEVSSAISDEGRAMYNAAVKRGFHTICQGLTFWSPNVNIFRDPRWGRGHETYGEDPFLTGTIGTAFVKGMQGDDPKYLKTSACAKHFAVHSGPEGLRHEFNAVVSDKDLYETYLPAFKALVDANVESVMCAYNRTDDEPCCGSNRLLTRILRNDWGFKGHVVSDCGALANIHGDHHFTATAEQTVALAIQNQVNLNCGDTYKAIPSAVKQGLITEKEVDKVLHGLLKTRFKLGMFDPESANPYNKIGSEVVHSEAHKQLARKVAQKSVVLLKNNGVLPMAKDCPSVFVTGPMAGNIDVLISNYYGISDDMSTILEGIAGKIADGSKIGYRYGILPDRENLNPMDWSTGMAGEAEVTVAVLGVSPLNEGEEGEAIASSDKGDRLDTRLPESQLNYLRKLKIAAGKKKIVVVLTGGSAITSPEIEALADAILFVWYPGEQGGKAVADVLFGDANPCGRLPVTFPKSISDIPAFENYSMVGRTYRYMEKEPLFPFGFGLSYTKFSYSNLKLSAEKIKKGESVTASFKVSNTGQLAGEEVTQLYITDQTASFRVPIQSLKGFKKISLEAGASQEISFIVTPELMSSVDESGKSVIGKGNILLTIGGASPGKRSLDLGAAEFLKGTFVVK